MYKLIGPLLAAALLLVACDLNDEPVEETANAGEATAVGEEPADTEPAAPEPAESEPDEPPIEEPEESAEELPPAEPFEIVDGPVTADSSQYDWNAFLQGDTESLPGLAEVFVGSGDDIIDLDVAAPSFVVAAHHQGSRNFIVRAADAAGDTRGVVNSIGTYSGLILAEGRGDDVVGFDVAADGDWVVVVMSPLLVRGTDLARTYEGVGDSVIVFPFDTDDPQPIVEFGRMTATHDGERNFIVRELFGRGLVNEIGAYDGTVRPSRDGLFGVTINADGAWTLSFE